MQSHLNSRISSANDLLKSLQLSPGYYQKVQNMNRQNALLLSQFYIAEHEQYLQNVRRKNQQIQKCAPVFLIPRQNVTCQSQENNNSNYNRKTEKAGQLVVKLIESIKPNENLKKCFERKFGTLEKMEALWNEQKYVKLLYKLMKVVVKITESIKQTNLDSLLLTARSHQVDGQETLSSKKKKFSKGITISSHQNEDLSIKKLYQNRLKEIRSKEDSQNLRGSQQFTRTNSSLITVPPSDKTNKSSSNKTLDIGDKKYHQKNDIIKTTQSEKQESVIAKRKNQNKFKD